MVFLIALLFLVSLASLGMGAVTIPFGEALAIAWRNVIGRSNDAHAIDYVVTVEQLRLPRTAMAVLVGMGLATAGAALQGIFRNPLADPGLIGVSSGAALGGVASIVIGFNSLGRFSLPASAFLGALTVTIVVYLSARRDGRTEIVTLLLTGIAVNAMTAAAIGYFIFRADDQQLRGITFWQLGSVASAAWPTIGAALPFLVIGMVGLLANARPLNLLALGEREATHLGLNTERTRVIVIGCAALVVGASVASVGAVAFVGLVVPHLLRLVTGPDHRVLLPAAALGGGILLAAADICARTIAIPREVPIGVVTAMVGGAFFFYLLRKVRRAQGGWG